MGHPIHTVKAFEVIGPYRLRIEFGDGVVRTIDFQPILEGELYGPLRDLSQFNAVALDMSRPEEALHSARGHAVVAAIQAVAPGHQRRRSGLRFS